jgi:tetratricopeptide (TPR) repeat protein
MPSNIRSETVVMNRAAHFLLAVTTTFTPFMLQGQSSQRPVEAHAESAGTATLQGVVRDSGNRSVAGVTVCLQSEGAQTLMARTDSAGTYRFSAVRQGVYTLRAEMAGYGSAIVSALVLGQRESRTIDLSIEPAKASPPQSSSTGLPEFFDEPHFTVAGVTDTTSLGGHGSDTIVRNRDALAEATASLRKERPGETDKDEAGRHHLLADADERRGDPLEAVREYQGAAELNPSESNLFDWGSELLLHKAPEPALEVFSKGNRLFPQSIRMLAGLGASLYALGSYDQAAQRLCEASDLNPDDPDPYLFMGKMQSAESVQSEAIAERLRRFVTLQPQNAFANYYYAVSLWKRRKSPEDIQDLAQVKSMLEKAVHLDPQFGLAYLQLGVLYSERKDLSSAISAYQQAIKATPRLEEAHYRLARVYRQAGDAPKAQAELQLYTQISNENKDEIERQRHEVQQFVYQLRDQPAAPPPQ